MENNTVEKTRKMSVAQALVGQIREKNEQSIIKTNLLEGFRSPDKLTVVAEEKKEYIPDIVSKTGERMDLYEIELNEQNYVLEKWRRFSEYSTSTNGSFNIVVPEPKLEKLKDLLDLNKIPANVIYYNT